MDFKRKLATMLKPLPHAPAPESALAESALSAGTAAAGERGSTLEQLRLKMAAILASTAVQPRVRPAPVELDFSYSGSALPFVREERASGPLFRRHQVLPPSHHVGRMPVDAARRRSRSATSRSRSRLSPMSRASRCR